MLPLLEKILSAKKPSSGLPGSLLAQYRALAESMGFKAENIEKGLLLTGKTVKLAIKVEFGNRWEFFNTITSLRETGADIKVLSTSSNSRAMPMETAYTVLKKKLGEKARWALLDIEGKKEPMFLNFSVSDLGKYAKKPYGARAAPPSRSGGGARPPSLRPSRPRSSPSMGEPGPYPHSGPHEGHSRRKGPRKGGAGSSGGGAGSRPIAQEGTASRENPPAMGKESGESHDSRERKPGLIQSVFDRARMTLSRYSVGGPKPVLLKKTKNYGLQPADAPPRRKKIYGKRKKKRD
jgi:hypothetical protein